MRYLSTVVTLACLWAGCSSSDDGASRSDVTADTQSNDALAPDTPAALDSELQPDADTSSQTLGEIELPRDESPHSTPVEWWYYTGLLTTPDQQRYGFEQVVFQFIVNDAPLYMSHFAISDLQSLSFTTAMKTSLDDQREAVPVGFSFDVDGWTMSGHAGRDETSFAMDGIALDLSLTPIKPAVAQYGNGVMTLGSDEPFYYYSYTRMEAVGKLTLNGAVLDVNGEAWMDHQWGEVGTGFDGWDWYSLRFDDNTEVMLFAVRKPEGDQFGGTFVDTDGSATALQPADIIIEALGSWQSPHTGRVYPMGWKVSIPPLQLDATVNPLFEDQEFTHHFGDSPIYWEGICDIVGERAGDEVTGYAYVELVNYPAAQ